MANTEYKCWDKGKGVAGYKKFLDQSLCQGKFYILLHNDNNVVGINVGIKVIAIVETNVYENKNYIETKINPVKEKKIFKEPSIFLKKVLVQAD
ncbi:MAG TPA: hypothetical protein VD905_20025 [Flavobacteriales bacterium]|nr:hypothetical protein [Flavobacteriales bacterium]